MMKFTQAINVAVASVLVVPAVTLQGGVAHSLRESLDRTLVALETLAGIDQRLQVEGREAVAEVLEHTEPALAQDAGDPAARDRLLDSLRADVGSLQAELDRAQRAAAPRADQQPLELALEPAAQAAVTTGLDDDLRALLASSRARPRITAPAERAPKQAAAEDPEKLALEGEDFTADPLRLAQAYYRKGRFEQAVALLEEKGQGPEALYWKARSLEKLGLHEAAIEAYTAVSGREDAGALASRALEDIEFLKWRLEFEQQTRGKSSN